MLSRRSSSIRDCYSSVETIWERSSKLSHNQILLCLVASCLLTLLSVLSSKRSSKAPKIPTPPWVKHWIPWVGSAIRYGLDPVRFLEECRIQHGNVFTFILFGRRMTVVLGPNGQHIVLGGKLEEVSARDAYTHFTTPVFGEGVAYDVPHDVWVQQKRFFKSGFSLDKLISYVPLIEEETNDFINIILQTSTSDGSWTSFSARKKMSELTIFTASRTMQGKDIRSSLDENFARHFEDLDGGFTPLNFIFPNLPLSSYRKRDKAQKLLANFFIEAVARRKRLGIESDDNMLASLTYQRYNDGRPIPQQEIAHLMIAALMAGQHTSAATTAWVILHLAHRQDITAALLAEQQEILGEHTGDDSAYLTFVVVGQLSLLNAVIKETLRLHPPISSIIRKVVGDIHVDDGDAGGPYIIPKGHFVLACPAHLQVDPRYWRDPLMWDPYRWLTLEPSPGIHGGTTSIYLPFGAGRHRCLGDRFAHLQTAVIISTFIRQLEMKLEGAFSESDHSSMIVLPKEPTVVLCRRRVQ